MTSALMTSSQRCFYLDLAKVMATLLVIFGHLYSVDSTVRLYLYAFHMPLFFIISGVFHRDTQRIEWGKYIRTILWPTLIFIILSAAESLLYLGTSWNDLFHSYFIDLLKGRFQSIFWFLFALFWCKVLTDCYIILQKPFLFTLLWAVLLFVPILLNKRFPLELIQGLMALPFYLVGYLCKRFFLNRNKSFWYLLSFFVCLLLTVLISKFHGRVSMLGVHFGQLAQHLNIDMQSASIPTRLGILGVDVILFYMNGIIGSIVVLSLALLPFPEIPLISRFSKSLISVVGTQYLFITPIVRNWGYDQSFWVSCGWTLLIFCLCHLMHLILQPVYKAFNKA